MPKSIFLKMLVEKVKNDGLDLHAAKRGEPIQSFSQLVKKLVQDDTTTFSKFSKTLDEANLIEDSEILYNGAPLAVYYKQLPIVVGSDVLVKIVLLSRGDSFALIMPENTAEAHTELTEDPTKLIDKNVNLSLYAEIYNFDGTEQSFKDVIKKAYLSAGNSTKAFELTDDLEGADNEEEAGGDVDRPSFSGSGGAGGSFPEMDEPIEDMPEIGDNLESYKSFNKAGNILESLVAKLYEKSSKVMRGNVRMKFFSKDNSLLLLEVNNKGVYNLLESAPKVAKKTLSSFGERIRKNNGVQLVDSFQKDGKRYFVIAETNNNYWYVKDDMLSIHDKDEIIFEPIQENIVRLNHSNVRVDSRKVKPYLRDSKVVFTGGNLNGK